MSDPDHRAKSVAVYLSPSKSTTPLALKADVERHGDVPREGRDRVGRSRRRPARRQGRQLLVETLGSGLFKVRHITLRAGYHDTTDIPAALVLARKRGMLDRNLDLEHASYFLSRIRVTLTPSPDMSRWRKLLFIGMARNAASPIDTYRLPVDRTATVGALIGI